MVALKNQRLAAFALLITLVRSGWMIPEALAEPPQSLAILLNLLKAQSLGLYDGMRLFRVKQPDGGTITLTVSCEREQWRLQSSDPMNGQSSFYGSPFLSAKGIGQTWVCADPVRILE
mgnify:CR=1 FL=1